MMKNTSETIITSRLCKLFNSLPFHSWMEPTVDTVLKRLEIIKQAATAVDAASIGLKQYVETNTAYIEYCTGSEMEPRGYYTPNPLLDIIASNYRRGRKVKQQPERLPYMVYHFNGNNEMIMIEGRGNGWDSFDAIELILRFSCFRAGFRYRGNDRTPQRSMDVCIECKSENGEKYTISAYTVYFINGKPSVSKSIRSDQIVFIGGMPCVDNMISEFIREADDRDYMEIFCAAESIEEIPNHKGLLYSKTAQEIEVFYDDAGLPFACKDRGEPCRPGRIKKPVLSGMM